MDEAGGFGAESGKPAFSRSTTAPAAGAPIDPEGDLIFRELTFPPHVSPEARSFVLACLELEAMDRPTLQALLETDFARKQSTGDEEMAAAVEAIEVSCRNHVR